MTFTFHAVVRCEGCTAVFVVDATTKAAVEGSAARDAAQDAGWAVRRNHGGRDLCPVCR